MELHYMEENVFQTLMWLYVYGWIKQTCIMRATRYPSRIQASGPAARVETRMNQTRSPSAIQDKHLDHTLQTSIGKVKDWISGRFAVEWLTPVLKTSNTQMVNSGNRQTPATKHRLLAAFEAQAMFNASLFGTHSDAASLSHVQCDVEGVEMHNAYTKTIRSVMFEFCL